MTLRIMLLAVFILTKPSMASSYDKSAVLLNEIIVTTGTKSNKSLLDAPVKTEVVQEEEIISYHFDSLQDTLSILPGVNTQQNTGRAGYSAIMQGLGGRHVLVAVDGIPVLQKSSSGYDLTQISTENIERIEVIKGGASSLYGSQAIGGVINIITKKESESRDYFFDAKTGYFPDIKSAQENTPNNIKASYSDNIFKKVFGRLSFSQRKRGEYDLDPESIATDLNELDNKSATLFIKVPLSSSSKVSINYDLISEQTQQVTSVVTTGGYTKRDNRTKTLSESLTLFHDVRLGDSWKINSSANYKNIKDEIVLGDDPSTNFIEEVKTADQNSFRLESQVDYFVTDDNMLTMGFLYSEESLNQRNLSSAGVSSLESIEVDDKNNNSIETYLQNDIILGQWELTPGFRYQKNQSFGDHQSASLNVVYSPEIFNQYKTKIRTSVGSGYRVPSLKERFYLLDHRNIANYIVQGNENLEAESSLGYQLGIELINRKKTSFHINTFFNQIDGLISIKDRGIAVDGIRNFQYINLDKVQTYGSEISHALSLYKSFKIDQEFTYTVTKNLSNGLQLPRRPKYMYHLRLSYRILDDLQAIQGLQYFGNQFIDDSNTSITNSYSLVNAKLNYDFNSNTKFYFGVDNIMNKTRDPLLDSINQVIGNGPVLGRFFYLGFNIRG